jgi:phosphatidylserine/phosphatidylglycerophosphate/cardiolipin synthase-like enzyme
VADLEVTFLEAGKQTAEAVAQRLAAFVRQATSRIDIAIYDMHLTGAARDIVIGALQERQAAGVRVRICYDSGDDPSKAERLDAQPQTTMTGTFLAATGLPSKAIISDRHLMHHKYVIIDAYTPRAQVWTGSSNFTDASWSLQENNLLILPSAALANFYIQDFQELWTTGDIQTTGTNDTGRVTLSYAGAPAPTTVSFAPGQGEWIDAQVARCVGRAQREVTMATVVLTSGHILGALGDLMERGVAIDGIYDRTQMEGVFAQWQANPHAGWKTPAFQAIVQYAGLTGKQSTPWTPTSVHDFMHNKLLVVDDTVITGSYNFSRNAQANAENILLIESPALAAVYRDYIRGLAARYGQTG